MAEYIKRDTAIRAVMAAKWVDGSDGAMAMEIVASPPAADVVPVCGGEARLFVNDGVRVLCTKCRASSKVLVDSECYKTSAVEKVIEAWNRRADND